LADYQGDKYLHNFFVGFAYFANEPYPHHKSKMEVIEGGLYKIRKILNDHLSQERIPYSKILWQ